jgi:enolase
MTDTSIVSIHPRRIWDSRGRPTIEVDMRLASGAVGRGVAPAGASRGSHEATDRRDGGPAFGGYDVRQAIAGIESEIAPALRGMDAADQAAIDRTLIALDGTPTKSRLGGNAVVAVSLAALHAAAAAHGRPVWRHLAGGAPVRLPLPEIQIFGGGAHAGRRIDIQDLMVMPVGARSFAEALDMVAEVHRAAGAVMAERGAIAGVADEGGYWPLFSTNEEALDALLLSIERSGLVPGDQVAISLDVAASEFGAAGHYRLGLEERVLDSDGLCDLLLSWCRRYPILSVEDPLGEDDVAGLARFTAAIGDRVQVIGDDHLVTNAARVAAAAGARTVNAILLKVNQAGTVTETAEAMAAARQAGFGTVVSARSGETEDVAVAHLAVGWNAGQMKVGSFTRSERMAKWNEVLRIEEELGSAAVFAGRGAFPFRS